jgi:hypothetical protein
MNPTLTPSRGVRGSLSISTSAELSEQCGGGARVYNMRHHEALQG